MAPHWLHFGSKRLMARASIWKLARSVRRTRCRGRRPRPTRGKSTARTRSATRPSRPGGAASL
eukprot:5458388-Pyramimonas_sp.AAC.1